MRCTSSTIRVCVTVDAGYLPSHYTCREGTSGLPEHLDSDVAALCAELDGRLDAAEVKGALPLCCRLAHLCLRVSVQHEVENGQRKPCQTWRRPHVKAAATGQALSQAAVAVAAVGAEQNLHCSRVGHLTGMLADARSTAAAAEQQLSVVAKQVYALLMLSVGVVRS